MGQRRVREVVPTWREGALPAALLAASAAAAAPPPNDDCADAISVTPGAVAGTTAGATNDGPGGCGDSSTTGDVWYAYTPAVDGFLEVAACSAAYNTVLGIWDECPGTGQELACNDNCCILQSIVSLLVDGGEDYYIRVAGWNGATGSFQLDITLDSDYLVGPDVIYSNVTTITHWGAVGDVHGYSLASYTCNVGDLPLQWGDVTPLLATGAYRLANGRLEQIGMSWVKNGTSSVAAAGCGLPCGGEDGCLLGAGCRDAYTSGYNGIYAILGPRSQVNAFTGEYPGVSGATDGDAIYKRLQVASADLSAGGLYFVEGQYVAPDDAAAGNAMNNASYRRVTVAGNLDLTPTDTMVVGTPAIHAWRDHGGGPGIPDPSVAIVEVDVPGEGRFHVAARVSDLGDGHYHYDYAVHNMNSHRSAGAFTVPVGGATVSTSGFHDVNYHSGEPYDNTDWSVALESGLIRWSSPQTYLENPDSNALRWATMYNFWLVADRPPVSAEAVISLFRPGDPDSVTVVVPAPSAGCGPDVNGDGTVDVQDLVAVITSWGPCAGCPADVDGDGDVDVADLVEVIVGWGACG